MKVKKIFLKEFNSDTLISHFSNFRIAANYIYDNYNLYRPMIIIIYFMNHVDIFFANNLRMALRFNDVISPKAKMNHIQCEHY